MENVISLLAWSGVKILKTVQGWDTASLFIIDRDDQALTSNNPANAKIWTIELGVKLKQENVLTMSFDT